MSTGIKVSDVLKQPIWDSMNLLTKEQQTKCALLGIIVFIRDHSIYVRLDDDKIYWMRNRREAKHGAVVFKTVNEAIERSVRVLAGEDQEALFRWDQ